MIHQAIPRVVVDTILDPLAVAETQPVMPGMSGAVVYRCRMASGEQAALKRWPSGTDPARVAEVHQVMRRAREGGCRFVPQVYDWPQPSGSPATALLDGAAVWEFAEWVAGEPAATDASLEIVRTGAAAIAEFHKAVEPLGVVSQPPPAVRSRLKRLQQLESQLPQAIERADRTQGHPELAVAVRAASRCFRLRWNDVCHRIRASLVPHDQQSVPTQYVLRDVHRGHVLWQAGKPSGVIDYDAIRVDTPATDLARWVGSFMVGPHEEDQIWQAALAGFRGESPLFRGSGDPFSPMLARDLCFATNWISLANWLVWIVCEQRTFAAGPRAVSERIGELLHRVS